MLVKTQVVLFMYEKLLNGENIYLDEIIGEFEISLRTFRRYINEINIYLANFNKFKQIKYSMKNKYYYMESY